MSTDINSLLGAIVIGNMCKFATFVSVPHEELR